MLQHIESDDLAPASPSRALAGVLPPAADTSENDGQSWRMIHDRDHALIVEERELGAIAEAAEQVLSEEEGHWKASGKPGAAVAALGQIPAALAVDIQMLATRLAALMQVETVTIRLEVVSTNACRKIHADNTDLRLITTYAGPGTQVLPPHSEVDPDNLWTMPTGWVGLFKGRAFGEGHEACLHRSPPMGDMGGERLVLVIDTPAFAREGACA